MYKKKGARSFRKAKSFNRKTTDAEREKKSCTVSREGKES